MKNSSDKKGIVLRWISILVVIATVLVSIQPLAQIVTDADLIKENEVTHHWYAQSLFWAIIILMIIVVMVGFYRSNNKSKRRGSIH